MGACRDCGKEMETAASCDKRYFKVIGGETARQKKDMGKLVKRLTKSNISAGQRRCHDCGIIMKSGNTHHYGCDWERCPIDKGQAITCGHDFVAVDGRGQQRPMPQVMTKQQSAGTSPFDAGFRSVTR